jgi:hypothetical protein
MLSISKHICQWIFINIFQLKDNQANAWIDLSKDLPQMISLTDDATTCPTQNFRLSKNLKNSR